MSLNDFRPRWRIGLRRPCSTSVALPLVVDVLSGVPTVMRSQRRHACSASASAPHFARHRQRPLHGMDSHVATPVHARFSVHSAVQTACPERARPAAWRAFAGRQAAPCAAPPGHRIPVLSGREKMQGKIKGRGTSLREKTVCTWGWRGTRRVAAPCRVVRQCLAGIEESVCRTRLALIVLDGGTA